MLGSENDYQVVLNPYDAVNLDLGQAESVNESGVVMHQIQSYEDVFEPPDFLLPLVTVCAGYDDAPCMKSSGNAPNPRAYRLSAVPSIKIIRCHMSMLTSEEILF